MKLVVGLGNPGSQYKGTRHNIGFEVVAELVRRLIPGRPQSRFHSEVYESFVGGEKVLLIAPQTFMNRSGEAVRQVVKFYQVAADDIVVICDDMNLPAGKLRWRGSGSSGGQKGLSDILQKLGSENVPRLRMGVGRPPGQIDPADWVLSKFRPDERADVELMTVLAADSVDLWIKEGLVSVMNRYNRSSGD
ncbi:MAG: aminoacyl-tRNA hydrolase [Planctomycetota bacterium]